MRPSCADSTAEPRGAMMSIAWCLRTPLSRGSSNESSRRVLSMPATGNARVLRCATAVASAGEYEVAVASAGLLRVTLVRAGEAAGTTIHGDRCEHAVRIEKAARRLIRRVM